MDIDHGTLVAFAKSWGLFYLIGMFLCVVVYAFWPANRKRFDGAKRASSIRTTGHGSRGNAIPSPGGRRRATSGTASRSSTRPCRAAS